jgi:DNA (cytosine-5)-methyltransferase 1
LLLAQGFHEHPRFEGKNELGSRRYTCSFFGQMRHTAVELCAGGGGQALGLELAGFDHQAAVEYEAGFCSTLSTNRPHWDVRNQDIRDVTPSDFAGVDLLAAGVPCPPFSIAGKQLGSDDERDMFPAALKIVKASRPRAVLFENVPGLATAKFSAYRDELLKNLSRLGYQPEWKVLQAADFGVPQLRPRFVLVALRSDDAERFRWPVPMARKLTVGQTLVDLMGANGWTGAMDWAQRANSIAPTVVGGSKKHGGPDLGPTRAKRQWKELSVDGMGIANDAPDSLFPEDKDPRLTVRMVARIQGFPDSWHFAGKKTISYRQVGNAFPPPVAHAVGKAIRAAFKEKPSFTKEESDGMFESRLLEEPTKLKTRCRDPKAQKL